MDDSTGPISGNGGKLAGFSPTAARRFSRSGQAVFTKRSKKPGQACNRSLKTRPALNALVKCEWPLRVVSGPSEAYQLNGRYRGHSGHYADRIFGRFTTTMGPQIQVPPGANLLFLNLSMTPFVTPLHFQKGLF